MLTILKYIDYARKARQGYHAPEELLADTSFGFIEGFFIMAFVLTGLLSGGLIFLGFYFSLLLLKILGFVALLGLVIEITLYIIVKRVNTSISKRIVTEVKSQMRHQNKEEFSTHDLR